jgi:multiple sugar transport system substrate-binding protein
MLSQIRALLLWLAALALVVTGFWWAGHSREPEMQAGRKVITWMLHISPLRDLYEQQVAEFERLHPDIAVRLIWVPESEYHMKFKTLAAAGQTPDMFYSGDVWLSYLRPFMADLTPLVARDAAEIGLEDYFPEIRAAMQHEGHYFVLPESMNISLLYFNRRLFREAGVEAPTADWTWDDLVRAGQRLTRPASGDRPGVWGCSRMAGWWGEWLIFVRQAGGTVFTPDGRRCALDSPAAITGLRFYLEKSSKYGISAPAGFEPLNGFVNERVAMIMGGHINFWLNYNAVPGLDWDVQMLPAGPAGRRGGEVAFAGYALSKTTRRREAAWELMKFLTRPAVTAAIVARGGTSVRRSIAETEMHDPRRQGRPQNLAAVYRQLEFSLPIPRHPNFLEIMLQVVQPEVDRMVLGELTPEEAGRRAAAAVNAFLDTFDPQAR